MQPIHQLVYAGIGAGVLIYLIGLLLVKVTPQPRFFRFCPGLLALVASMILLWLIVPAGNDESWTGILAFCLALISTSLIGLVLLLFQLFYRLGKGYARP
ncbi:hypothetical protein [Paenibacillus dauci]|uniref:hypothetical protein n=1 Tax=Paenibacillus dauci TaxID=1567106 RepID=UPI000619578D|nr:hypothetical protein [Paenibacillus dauci]